MLKSAKLRLAGRALIAGLVAFGVSLQASNSYTREALIGAATAGALAFVEVFTPLNPVVGFFKKSPEAKVLMGDLVKALNDPTASSVFTKGELIAAVKEVAK